MEDNTGSAPKSPRSDEDTHMEVANTSFGDFMRKTATFHAAGKSNRGQYTLGKGDSFEQSNYSRVSGKTTPEEVQFSPAGTYEKKKRDYDEDVSMNDIETNSENTVYKMVCDEKAKLDSKNVD